MLHDLNRIIARTMRRIQLTPNETVCLFLKQAMSWLNRARRNAKRGREDWAREDLAYAMRRIQAARRLALELGA